mmetsp:Transcript_3608/g.10642  ORF Transcript_3608/g.10642 Transcript_3608/m.10642 type:complete len:234 (-) Transcript_3608:344-1045(-)
MNFSYFRLRAGTLAVLITTVRLAQREQKLVHEVVRPLRPEVGREEAVRRVARRVEGVVVRVRRARGACSTRVRGAAGHGVHVGVQVRDEGREQDVPHRLRALLRGEAPVQHLPREEAVVVVPLRRHLAPQRLVRRAHGVQARGVVGHAPVLSSSRGRLRVHDAQVFSRAELEQVDAQQRRVGPLQHRVPERVEDLEALAAVEVRHAHAPEVPGDLEDARPHAGLRALGAGLCR